MRGFEIGIGLTNLIKKLDIPLIRDADLFNTIRAFPLLLKRASKHDLYIHVTPQHLYMGPYTRGCKKLKRTIVMLYLEIYMKGLLQLEDIKLDVALLLNEQEEMWLRVPAFKIYKEDDFVFESSCNDKEANHYVKRSLRSESFDLTSMTDEQRRDVVTHLYFRYIFGVGGAYSSSVYMNGETMFTINMGLKSKPRAAKMMINLLLRSPSFDEMEIIPKYYTTFARFNTSGEYAFIEMMKVLRGLGVNETSIFEIKERRKVFEDCLDLFLKQCNNTNNNAELNKID
jgi:hypothetical protein